MKRIGAILLYGIFFGGFTAAYSDDGNLSAAPQTIDFGDMSLSITDGYQPTSSYILNPETAIDYIKGIAAFRMKSRDNTNGGFYSFITRQGYSAKVNEKALCGQSRIAYAFTRAFMVTGDERYLEQAHHALKFLYDHGWNNGWYFATDSAGNYISHWGHNNWWGFQQHYALVGIAAMVEATCGNYNWNDGSQTDKAWLMRGIASNYNNLWDAASASKGYYTYANTAWTSKWGKGFHSTVDGITTHALEMALLYPDSAKHTQRLVDLAGNIVDHMIGNMSVANAGFPEIYNSDWSIDYSNTNMDIGHGFKTAWVLQRAYLRNQTHTEYLAGAQTLMQNLWDHGCYDTVYGAPYSYLNWQTGAVTSTNKDFWMTEQGFTSGLISYYTATTQTQRDRYLQIADGSINFFMNHIIDPVYGEAYSVVNRDGSSVVDTSKGGEFTAGYHATELGYYAYLYSSLYYHKTPVRLYYYYPAESAERTIKLTPVAIEEDVLKILAVTLDGASYTDFNKDARTIHLPAAAGGKLEVTFGFATTPTDTITTTAGAGGSISPSGTVTVSQGSSSTFTMTPSTGYAISSVTVDGSPVGTGSTYTFTNVTRNHTISVAFAIAPYTITASAGSNGSISPSGTVTVSAGSSRTFTITPSAGYQVAGVLVDGVSVGAMTSYSFTSIAASHTIGATFSSLAVYQINCGGSASPPYAADQYYSGGTARTVTSAITTTGVTNPAPQAVYQAERYGTVTYTIPGLTAAVSYAVRLHFAELYWTATGKRTFNVAINGTTVLSNYDIYSATGARYKAVVKEFTATANSSGQIIIKLTTVTDNATVEGIEIINLTANAAPTIATAASATPSPVTGTTTALSALGTDDKGESNLTYTWATIGTSPASVTFSANGTNAAKAVTAIFTKAGDYMFQVTVKDAEGLTVTSTVSVTVDQTLAGIAVSPSSASVPIAATQQFTASGVDQFSTDMSTQPTITWSVSGVGTISASGLYSAGTTVGTATVTAASGNVSKTASVTVTPTTVYQINCGAGASSPFTADQYYSGGTARTVTSAITTTGVTNPAPQAVYQSERYGTTTYTLPSLTSGASYTVRLHFAELYWTATGKRKFNVAINGTTVLSNYDIYSVTGARYKAVAKEFPATANTSGQIVIKFTTVTDNATIEGIEIIKK